MKRRKKKPAPKLPVPEETDEMDATAIVDEVVERTVPSRMAQCPTSDGTSAITGKRPPRTSVYNCAVVKVHGI
jgi:hypothetical protein